MEPVTFSSGNVWGLDGCWGGPADHGNVNDNGNCSSWSCIGFCSDRRSSDCNDSSCNIAHLGSSGHWGCSVCSCRSSCATFLQFACETQDSMDAQSPSADPVCRVLQGFQKGLQHATCHFCQRRGGYNGLVFRGTLRCGTHVAVKNSNPTSSQAEIKVLGRVRHPNIVTPIGFAFPGPLVYELASADLRARLYLDSELHWQARLQIAHDISKGLAFLQGCRPKVFHRDIKLDNVLLDFRGTAKVADFGMAVLSETSTFHSEVVGWAPMPKI